MADIVISEKVSALIAEREDWGRAKEAREEALYQVYGNEYNAKEIAVILQKINGVGGINVDLTIDKSRGLIYIGSESEVIERLSKIKRIEKQTPKWMVIRMISTRLAKMYGAKFRYNQPKTTPQLTRDKVTPKSVKAWMEWEFEDKVKKASRELVRILNRGDVTEDMIDEAWDQVKVQGVMES